MGRKKSKGGAPSKLTAEVRAKILEGLRSCLPYEHAAALAEVAGRTLRDWRKRGRKEPSSEYGGFLREMRLARASGLARLGTTVYTAAVGDPASGAKPKPDVALEVLERRDAKNWGKRRQLDVGNAGGKPFKTESVGDDGLLEKLEHIEEMLAKQEG